MTPMVNAVVASLTLAWARSVVQARRLAGSLRTAAWVGLVSAGLWACGGGSNFAGGVGSGGTGLAEGSVTGFGSVIVDGVEYDDSTVVARQSDATGAVNDVSVKLGQRVRVFYSTAAGSTVPIVQSLQVLPQLIGPVTQAADKNGWVQVLGQWVRLVRSGDDASRLGPTVLSGYDAVAGIRLGDDVQVHGDWVYDASKSASVLVASLVDKTSATVDPVQLGGVVQALTVGGFRLNAPSGTVVLSASLPAGLAPGQVVHVWAARAAVVNALGNGMPVANGTPVSALRVTTDTLGSAELANQQQVSVSGLATGYDPVTRTVQVQGVQVKLDAAVKVDEAALARGEFVSLQLVPGAASPGTGAGFVASGATVRTVGGAAPADRGSSTELKGAVSGVNWSAASVRFVLRGVQVEANAAAIDASCRTASAAGLAGTVNAEVTGTLLTAGSVVTASKVTCTPSMRREKS